MKNLTGLLLAVVLCVFGGEALAEISDVNLAINKAGRQRMLSQRMAKFYQALAWHVGNQTSASEPDKAQKEFATAHKELAAASVNTPKIQESLDLVNQ